jgi:hypothetical protein
MLGFGVFWDWLQSIIGRFAGFRHVIWREIFGIVKIIFGIVGIIFWKNVSVDFGDGDVVAIIHSCGGVTYGCGIIVTAIVGIIVGGGNIIVVVVIVIIGAGVPGVVGGVDVIGVPVVGVISIAISK